MRRLLVLFVLIARTASADRDAHGLAAAGVTFPGRETGNDLWTQDVGAFALAGLEWGLSSTHFRLGARIAFATASERALSPTNPLMRYSSDPNATLAAQASVLLSPTYTARVALGTFACHRCRELADPRLSLRAELWAGPTLGFIEARAIWFDAFHAPSSQRSDYTLTAGVGLGFDEPLDASPPAHTAQTWYGHEVLAADVAAAAFLAASYSYGPGSEPNHGLLVGATAVYALGGPFVHLRHHNSRSVVRSLGLRAAVIVAEGIALATEQPCYDGCDRVAGYYVGTAAAAIALVDAFALAHD